MQLTRGSQFSIVLGVMSLALFIFKLYFRAEIYSEMYKAPEDAYGISDIIELLLAAVLLILVAISMISAAILAVKGTRQSKIAALLLAILNILLLFMHNPLHHWATH